MSMNLHNIISSWKDFNLLKLQSELDKTASDITCKQDESEVSRKKLVENLKEFKKSASEEMRRTSGSLIKEFQKEVDYLNKRSKFAETAFLKVYEFFLDVKEPTACLEYALNLQKKIGRLEELELENKTMKETLTEYNDELMEVRNQDVTIKMLKEKLKKYEDDCNELTSSRVKEVEKELIGEYESKEQLVLETHRHTLRKLQESELRCNMLQQSFDQTQSQLFELKSRIDDASVATTDEMEILTNDIDKITQQYASSQKEVFRLRDLLENKTSTLVNEEIVNRCSLIEVSSLEAEVSAKDREISQLVHEVKNVQNNLCILNESSSLKVVELQSDLQKMSQDNANLKNLVLRQQDYDEIKKELDIIKSLEFGSCKSNENVSENKFEIKSKPLELLLLEKNKTLQNENTTLKLGKQNDFKKNSELEKEILQFKNMCSEQENLIKVLEADLMSIRDLAPSFTENEDFQCDTLSSAVKEVSISMASIEANQVLKNDDEVVQSCSAAESLLPIVSSQRERFRQRNIELEAELAEKVTTIFSFQNEVDSLRGDNIKLYEKIRFLQSFDNNKNTNSSLESRYSNQYEKSLDPFMTFSQKEQQRTYTQLSPFEKSTFALGSLILRSKGARTATFIYAVIMHCLVFLILYKLVNTESCKRDFASDCAKKFAEHMQQIHGDH